MCFHWPARAAAHEMYKIGHNQHQETNRQPDCILPFKHKKYEVRARSRYRCAYYSMHQLHDCYSSTSTRAHLRAEFSLVLMYC